jgi:hypothetical protein
MISRRIQDHRVTSDSKELAVTAWADLIPHRVQTSGCGNVPSGYTERGECLEVGEELPASQEKLRFRQLLHSSVLQ